MTRTARGFTLIEVLVALAILVLVGGLAMQVFGGGLRNTELADRMVRASAIGESLLASVGADHPVADGTVTGSAPDGFAWVLTMVPLPRDEQPSARVTVFRITVTVTWGVRPNERSITLESMALGAGS